MTSAAPSLPPSADRWLLSMLGLAVALPLLMSHAPAPEPKFYKDLLALLLGGAVLALAGGSLALRDALVAPRGSGGHAVAVAVLLMLLALAGSVLATGALPGQALTHAAVLLTALMMLGLGQAVGAAAATGSPSAGRLQQRLWAALLLAALANAVVGVLQLHAPAVLQSLGVAGAPAGGRAIGLMRQANNFATLLVWGMTALPALHALGALRPWALLAGAAVLVVGLVESGSRTGLMGVAGLALWGLLDRRLDRPARALLALGLPLLTLSFTLLGPLWAEQVGVGRLGGAPMSLSSPRWPLWASTLDLIADQPWTGVGWGNFNLAWMLTPMPERPAYAFNHAHNLLLHWAVELGLPLTLLLSCLLGWGLWRAFRGLATAPSPARSARAAALFVVWMAGLHSMTEYPLWYAHLLLPMALCWGLALSADTPAGVQPGRWVSRLAVAWPVACRAAGLLLILGAVLAWRSFLPVLDLLAPSDPRQSAEERALIAGQSWYAPAWGLRYEATLAVHGERSLTPFAQGAARFQLDDRLMLAWALTHAQLGDIDRAWYLGQRLKELGGPVAHRFFAHCAPAAAPPPAEPPRRPPPTFQCGQRTVALGWRDFL